MPQFRITVQGKDGPHSWLATYDSRKHAEAALRAERHENATIEERPVRLMEDDRSIYAEAIEREEAPSR